MYLCNELIIHTQITFSFYKNHVYPEILEERDKQKEDVYKIPQYVQK